MTKKNKKKKSASEFRLDAVSQNWVVIATGRARRPESFVSERKKEKKEAQKKCPFCKPSIKKEAILEYKNEKGQWSVIVIPNKFPAFFKEKELNIRKVGPYRVMNGAGFCEVVITRDHERQMAQFSPKEIKQVLDVYHERYLNLMNEEFVNYVSVFYNHGKEAGASVAHPHSQIMTLPVIDTDLKRSLFGSKQYYRNNRRKCVHCTMIDWEKKNKQRILFENRDFMVICPFISRIAFEIRIYPKAHHPYFERIKDREKDSLAEAFQAALSKLYKGLDDPSYNFFLLTAPCDGKDYNYYHWHWEILPKTSVWAGFELNTGIEISTIEPEKAAEYLRKQ